MTRLSKLSRSIDGEVAIVTGAARGIGLGIAERLTQDGCRVAAWDIDPAPLGAPDNSPFAQVAAVDVTDAEAVIQAVETTVANLGQVDILVNNAGVNGPTVPIWEYPLEDWQRVLAVDLTGVFHCCRAVVPHMRARAYGRIVNVASIASKEGNPNATAYCAAKAGVLGFTKALAKDLIDKNVLVNCVTPVITETDLFQEMSREHIDSMKSEIPMGRFCTVAEIAEMVAFVAGPRCSFTTGAVFDVSGGRASY